MSTAIEFKDISKQYRLGLVSTRTLSHDLNRWWSVNVLRKKDPYLKIGEVNDRASKGHSDYVWALKDINFKVEQGDVLGIIGKNGAGKSTLLKILSKVTAPTTGVIRAQGRIASLLEVGTGFHQEMTGRENIYMNGAIMGMTKTEITRKLDEIVDFSGCERYLDTPVKRYSSGMTVRLGFAIAAHLEPEILVVDEVLAVGDAEFQKKAIGKMQDVSKGEGRTVLFVSHNMASMIQLCKTGILMKNGSIQYTGTIDDVVSYYQHESLLVEQDDLLQRKDREGNGKIKLEAVTIESLEGQKISVVKTGDSFLIRLKLKKYSWTEKDSVSEFSICIKDENERRLIVLNDEFIGKNIQFDPMKNEYVISFWIKKLALNKGTYYLSLYLSDQFGVVDFIHRAIDIQVESGIYYEESIAISTGVGEFFQDYELIY